MRLKIIFFCIFILVSFVSCKKNTNGSDGNDVLHPEIAAFEKRRVELTADTDHAVFNKPIHLMTKCKPIFGGKGHITLHGPSSGLSLIFEAPIQDTIKTTEVTPKRLYNVTFNKNNLFELEWKIDLITELAGYVFYATAHFDSIFIEDSLKMYSVYSDEVRNHFKEGIDFYATSDKALELIFP